jgi:hypothetical protein
MGSCAALVGLQAPVSCRNLDDLLTHVSDEADVFLEQRDRGNIDLRRNAMVSGKCKHGCPLID